MNHGHKTFIDLIKEGFHVANRNLAVLLTQFISGIVLLFVFLFFAVSIVILGLGSLPKLDLSTLSVENLSGLVQTSLTLVLLGAVFGLLFLLVMAMVTGYVHGGNLGCIIDTARGDAHGFQSHTFFSDGRKFTWSMVALYILWGLVTFGMFLALFIVAGIGIEGILIPLRDSGRSILAFALGVPFIVVLILAGILFVFFLYAGWNFSGIILVGERKRALSAITHAYEFLKHNFWDSLLFALLMFALVFVGNIITNSIIGILNFGLSQSQFLLTLALLPLFIAGMLLQMYVGLIARSSFAVYYLDRTGQLALQPAAQAASPGAPEEAQNGSDDAIFPGPESPEE